MTNNSNWNNIVSELLDGFIHNNQQSMIIEELHDDPLSQMDQEQAQTRSTNISLQKSNSSILICGVCSAPASGYHFDQITCESCKLFFRRNALRDLTFMQCRCIGSCIINMETRSECAYCRLKKCFDVKMRKDWIHTDDEKELRQLQKLAKEQKKLNRTTNDQRLLMNLPIVIRRKKRLLVKPKIQELSVKPIFAQKIFGYNRDLSIEDRILLNNIINAYQFGVYSSPIARYDASTTFINFIHGKIDTYVSLICFYKHLPEFNHLDIDDQVLLLKRNLVNISHLHHIIVQNSHENPMIGTHMSRWISEDFYNQMPRTHRYFKRFIEHPLILKLALVVLIFSINLSTPRHTSQFYGYETPKKLHEIQNYYVTILY